MSESDFADYLSFIHKIKERLIIILDYKLKEKQELNQSEELFLKSMHRIWRTDDYLEKYCRPDHIPEDVSDQELF